MLSGQKSQVDHANDSLSKPLDGSSSYLLKQSACDPVAFSSAVE